MLVFDILTINFTLSGVALTVGDAVDANQISCLVDDETSNIINAGSFDAEEMQATRSVLDNFTCKNEVYCGNGYLDPEEVCDDGNLINDDGCESNCILSGCGNGFLNTGEECDDGNLNNDDDCDSNCIIINYSYQDLHEANEAGYTQCVEEKPPVINQLQTDLQQCENDKTTVEQQLNTANQLTADLQLQLDEALNQNDILTALLEEANNNNNTALQLQLDEANNQIRLLNTALVEANTEIGLLQSELNIANTINISLQSKLDIANTTNISLQSKLDIANTTNISLQSELNTATENINQLVTGLTEFASQLALPKGQRSSDLEFTGKYADLLNQILQAAVSPKGKIKKDKKKKSKKDKNKKNKK